MHSDRVKGLGFWIYVLKHFGGTVRHSETFLGQFQDSEAQAPTSAGVQFTDGWVFPKYSHKVSHKTPYITGVVWKAY